MNKISAIWNLFRKGQEVAQPGAWKDAQNFAFIIGGVLLALMNVLSSYGIDLPFALDLDTANTLGLGLATAIGFIVNNVTSAKTGILPAKPEQEPPVDQSNPLY